MLPYYYHHPATSTLTSSVSCHMLRWAALTTIIRHILVIHDVLCRLYLTFNLSHALSSSVIPLPGSHISLFYLMSIVVVSRSCLKRPLPSWSSTLHPSRQGLGGIYARPHIQWLQQFFRVFFSYFVSTLIPLQDGKSTWRVSSSSSPPVHRPLITLAPDHEHASLSPSIRPHLSLSASKYLAGS